MLYTMIDRDGKESRLLPAGQFRSWYETGRITKDILLRLDGVGTPRPLYDYAEFQDLVLAKLPAAAPPPVASRISMWGTISLLTGVASLVIGGWGMFISFAAIISGHVARHEARGEARGVIFGRRIALAGLLTGYLGALMALSASWGWLTSESGACRQQLNNVAVACIRYAADDEQHRLPPDLVTLVRRGYIDNGLFLACPAVQGPPTYGGRELAHAQYRDYLYLAEDVQLDQLKNPAKTLMIVERPGHHFFGAVNVVYCDGHAETIYKVGWTPSSTSPPKPARGQPR